MKAIKLLALVLIALVGMTACDTEESRTETRSWSFTGEGAVQVADQTFPAMMTVKATLNDNGFLTVEIPEYSLEDTPMGNITVGAVTIQNIAYSTDRSAFYRVYGKDGMSVTLDYGGKVKDYKFSDDSYIELNFTDNSINMVNSFKPGKMPMTIVSTLVVEPEMEEEILKKIDDEK